MNRTKSAGVRRCGKALALLLSALLCLTALPAAVLAEGFSPFGTAGESGAIRLGTDGLTNPTPVSDGSGTSYRPSSYIYLGTNAGTPIRWRVLDAGSGSDGAPGVFLLSEYLIAPEVQFSSDLASGAWEGSGAQAWCRNFVGLSGGMFNRAERDAIRETSKDESSGCVFGPRGVGITFKANTLTNEKVFFLSAKEAQSYLADYRKSSELIACDASGNVGTWWLRSPYADQPGETMAGVFEADGELALPFVNSRHAARPALNLDSAAVLFISPAVGGKSGGVSGLSSVDGYTGSEWKLTLADSYRSAFTASTAAVNGSTLTILYQNALTGPGEYLSVLVRDASGNVTHYGRIAQLGDSTQASGMVELDLSGIDMTGKTLYAFSEQLNGDYAADYASALVELPLTSSSGEAELPFQFITAVGDGSGSWLNGVVYDPEAASNRMTETQTNVYEITYTGVAKSDGYNVRFTADGSWSDAWGSDSGELSGAAVYGGDTIEFAVAADNSTVHLVLDLSGYNYSTKQGARYSITVTEPQPAVPTSVYVAGVPLLPDTNYINDGAGGIQVSDSGVYNVKVTEDASGYVLTLNGLNVVGKTNNDNASYKSSAIYIGDDKPLKIVVEADSYVTGAQTSMHSAGVYAASALTVTGGTLTATGGKARSGFSGSYGVFSNQTLTIENASLLAYGGEAGESSWGVFAKTIWILGDGTSVTAAGGKSGWRSGGVNASEEIWLNGGTVQASGFTCALAKKFETKTDKAVQYADATGGVTEDFKAVSSKTSLTVTLGVPTPPTYTVWLDTDGGTLSGDGVQTVTPNTLYKMQYQESTGLVLPRDTVIREGYRFVGWYENSGFGPIGTIAAGSSGDRMYYAKWEQYVASVTTAGEPPRTRLFTSLAGAILDAQPGETVALLADAVSADITGGSFVLDLNGHMLNVLSVSGGARVKLADSGWGTGSLGMISVQNGQIRDLCQDGYTLKLGAGWADDGQLSGQLLTGGIRVYALPIAGVAAAADRSILNCGYTDTAALTADAEMSTAPYYNGKTPSYQWCSVTGTGENRVETEIAGAVGASYAFPFGKGEGAYTFVCYASCDGYSVKSNDVTVAVERIDLADASVALGTQGIYDGSVQRVVLDSVIHAGTKLTEGTDYEIVSGDTATDVVSTVLTLRGMGSYSGVKEVSWSLQKAKPSLTADFAQSVLDMLNEGVDYTGEDIRIAPALRSGKSGMGRVDTFYAPANGGTTLRAVKNAGEYRVFFTIKEGQNYTAATLTDTLTVRPIEYPGVKTQSVTVRYDKANRDVAVPLPSLPDGASYGDVVFSFGFHADGSECGYSFFPSGQRGVENNILYVSTDSVGEPGIYGEVTVSVTGAVNYKDYTVTVRVICGERATVTFSGMENNQSFVYNGTEKTPAGTLTVSDGVDPDTLVRQYARIEGETVIPMNAAPIDVGSYQVTYSVPDTNDSFKGSVTYFFTVTPKPVTVTGITAEDKTYDGTTDAVLRTDGAVIDGKEDRDVLSVSASGEFTDASAGEEKTVRITALTLSGSGAGNYVLAEDGHQSEALADIRKASAGAAKTGELTVSNDYAYVYDTFRFSTLLPTLEGAKSFGRITYGAPGVALGSYYAGGASVDAADGTLLLPIVKNSSAAVGLIGTVTVTVSSTNYEDFLLTLNVFAENKRIPAGDPILSESELTYGDTLGRITLSGSMKDGGADVSGTFAWAAPDTVPNAGSYTAAWVFTPDDPLHYAAVSGSAVILVHKAGQTAPAAPELAGFTTNSITLKTIADNGNGAKAQYRIQGGEWQDSPVFTGLVSGTEYVFEARYAQTANYDASPAGAESRFSTDSSIYYPPVTLYFTLTFDTGDGAANQKAVFRAGTTVDLSGYVPEERAGLVFAGWYDASGTGARLTSVRMTGNKTVCAQWVSAAPSMPFTDVGQSDWFYEDVRYVYEKGLMLGTGETTFSPALTTTRGMIVTILYRLEGAPMIDGDCPFSDVKHGSYYEEAITWAAANGIVNGYGDGRFGPDDNITREQLAAIFYRYAYFKGMDVTTLAGLPAGFADAEDVSDYAVPAMSWAVSEGLIYGSSAVELSPKGDATRAQVAVILHRFLTK